MKYFPFLSFVFFFSFVLFFNTSCSNQKKEIDSTDSTAQSIDSLTFDFALVACNRFVVLKDMVDSNWAIGKAKETQSNEFGVYAAYKDVNIDAVDVKYKAMIGKSVLVYSEKGETIQAKIVALKMMNQVIPHFSQEMEWMSADKGNQTMSESGKEIDASDVKANQIWNTNNSYTLVAEFETNNKLDSVKCLFARPNYTQTAFGEIKSITPDVKALFDARKVLANTDDYMALQKEYELNSKVKNSNWWQNENSEETRFWCHLDADYLVVNHIVGNVCDDAFFAEKYSVCLVNDKEEAELMFVIDGTFRTISVIDIDGDKVPEFVLDDGMGKRFLLKKMGSDWKRMYGWNILNLNCLC